MVAFVAGAAEPLVITNIWSTFRAHRRARGKNILINTVNALYFSAKKYVRYTALAIAYHRISYLDARRGEISIRSGACHQRTLLGRLGPRV